MERTISGSGHARVKCALFAVFFTLASVSFSANAGGGSVMGNGGSLETTQLLNHAELVSQVGEATSTTANTLLSAQSTMQMLRKLPSGVIGDALSGLPVDKVKALADAYVVFSRASADYKAASDVLYKAYQDSERLGISPSELLRLKANAAATLGGEYQKMYEDEQSKLDRLSKTADDVQKQAEVVKSIDSNVGGIQFLASQNVKVQAALSDISHSVAKANVIALEENTRKQKEEEIRNKNEIKMIDSYNANHDKSVNAAKNIDATVIPLPGSKK
jgi:hypothetical protein